MRLQRVAPVAAVAFGVFTLGLDLASVPLDSITGSLGPGGQLADWVTTAVGVVPAVAVGTLLAARRPRNPIGWILLTIFLLAAAPVSDYAILDYRMHHGTLPLGWVAVALGSAWPILLVLIAILLWVFPDGQLPSGRWRRVSVILVASGLVLGLAASAQGVVAIARHDVRINASGKLTSPSTDALAVLPKVLVLGLLASGLTWLVVQVPRYRRSGGERREQPSSPLTSRSGSRRPASTRQLHCALLPGTAGGSCGQLDNDQQVAFAVFEPGRAVVVGLGDAGRFVEAGEVILLKLHATLLEVAHLGADVGDAEAHLGGRAGCLAAAGEEYELGGRVLRRRPAPAAHR